MLRDSATCALVFPSKAPAERNQTKSSDKMKTTRNANEYSAVMAPAWANRPDRLKEFKAQLPITTVAACIAAAALMFEDSAVHSVNVMATFSEVCVHRSGIVTSTSLL
jgi:hypothetical protein